jgi:hypothetical protein
MFTSRSKTRAVPVRTQPGSRVRTGAGG